MTNYSSSVLKNTQETYQHPWYIQQSLLENTTISESPLQQRQKSEGTGPRFIKTIEWAAGLYEGEGSLWYQKSTDAYTMGMEMTDYDTLYSFFITVNCGSIGKRARRPNMPEHHKDVYNWFVCKRDVIFNLGRSMYPYLGARRQAKIREFESHYYSKIG